MFPSLRTAVARLPLALAALVAAAALLLPASTLLAAEAEVEALLIDAYEDYDFLEIEEAQARLERALRIIESRSVSEDLVIEVWLLYGLVIHAATGDDEQTIRAFSEVIRRAPTAQIDSLYATPTLDNLMDEARRRVAPDAAPTPPPQAAPPTPTAPTATLVHTSPREAETGRSLGLRAEAPPSLGVQRVVIHYRRSGQTEYRNEPMLPLPGGVFEGSIPGEDIAGSSLDYYLEAYNGAGSAVATVGSAASPRRIMVRPAPERPGAARSAPRTRDRAPATDDDGHGFHVAMNLGTGFGLATASPRSYGEFVDLSSGFASSPLHFGFEAGWQPAGSALQVVPFLRLQTVFRDEGVDIQPLGGIKARYFFQQMESFGVYAEGGAGIGRVAHIVSIRLPPEVTEESVRDSTHEGPLHVGGGSGVVVRLSDLVGLRFGGYAMVLFPDFSLHVDVDAGLQFSF